MSGESKRDDDPDFLDDDFIVEDIAGKTEDLDQLFEGPSPAGSAAARPKSPPLPGAQDAEDLLFTDHTQGLEASSNFQGGPQFAEATQSHWSGDGLDLEEVGVPAADDPSGSAKRASGQGLGGDETSFTKELDSLLQSEEDFALDSEEDLEVVGAPDANAGDASAEVDEFEQSGPFVLDDGEGTWQEDKASEGTAELPIEPALAAAADSAAAEPGWEPLPGPSVDDLAEVSEVARVDDAEATGEASAGELVGASLAADGVDRGLVGTDGKSEVEGHDIYASEPGVVFVGPRPNRGRTWRLLVSLAASLMVLATGAVVVLRPELLGLRFEAKRVEQVAVQRPEVPVAVAIPRPPEVPAVEPSPAGPLPGQPEPPQPVPPSIPVVAQVGTPPSSEGPQPQPVPPTLPAVLPAPDPSPPIDPTPAPPVVQQAPVVVVEPPSAAVTPPGSERHSWPPAMGGERAPGIGTPPGFVRIGEDLMIGDQDGAPARPARAVEGVMPGSKAFAQLHNGNYFIGSVKCADAERITLRIDTGEVTLQVAGIARLTELGSSDYEDLQKVTSGFVRLTNNNRLVGGILRHIADDHIVLEFRSNRVMVPKSEIGEVVHGEGDAAVRLDTTREEDDWLSRLVERQLGTGTAPAPVPSTLPGLRTPR